MEIIFTTLIAILIVKIAQLAFQQWKTNRKP